MTREEQKAKDRWEYVSDRLCNSDYPIYNEENELECAFDAGVKWADAHPQDRWISVEDELPHGGVYLFCNSNGDVFIASDEIAFLYKNVTHWMPLPPAPKKGGEQ